MIDKEVKHVLKWMKQQALEHMKQKNPSPGKGQGRHGFALWLHSQFQSSSSHGLPVCLTRFGRVLELVQLLLNEHFLDYDIELKTVFFGSRLFGSEEDLVFCSSSSPSSGRRMLTAPPNFLSGASPESRNEVLLDSIRHCFPEEMKLTLSYEKRGAVVDYQPRKDGLLFHAEIQPQNNKDAWTYVAFLPDRTGTSWQVQTCRRSHPDSHVALSYLLEELLPIVSTMYNKEGENSTLTSTDGPAWKLARISDSKDVVLLDLLSKSAVQYHFQSRLIRNGAETKWKCRLDTTSSQSSSSSSSSTKKLEAQLKSARFYLDKYSDSFFLMGKVGGEKEEEKKIPKEEEQWHPISRRQRRGHRGGKNRLGRSSSSSIPVPVVVTSVPPTPPPLPTTTTMVYYPSSFPPPPPPLPPLTSTPSSQECYQDLLCRLQTLQLQLAQLQFQQQQQQQQQQHPFIYSSPPSSIFSTDPFS